MDMLYRIGLSAGVTSMILFIAADIVPAPWMAISSKAALAAAIGTLIVAGLWEACLDKGRLPPR
ncbi:hypothetical protein [Thauera linaloolentis]|nr:hypothetical protein [Thauera linaloolentis]MCM8564434.1 hypothetical protein [Thauera linaloolentis]